MRIATFCLARPTFDVALAQSKAEAAVASLARAGAEVVGGAELMMEAAPVEAHLAALKGEALDGVVIVQASFCDAEMAKRIAAALDAPLAIWAFPEARDGGRLRLNSFCGLNLAAHALGRMGRRVGWLHAPETETPDLAALFAPHGARATRAANAAGREAAERALAALAGPVALFGEHPDGFDTCDFDEDQVRELFGVSVDRVALPEFFDAARAEPADRVTALREETAARLDRLDEMEAEPLEKSLRLYAALRDMADARGLKAVAVRCWPEAFTEYGCAVCGAMARMNGEGVPAACEADFLGAVGCRLMQDLAGGPSLLVDIVDVDPGDDSAVFWHCGLAPLDFCDPQVRPEAALHTNRQKPLLHQFPMKPGRVTMARLSQSHGELKLVVGRGEMLRRKMAFTGTSGVVRPDCGAGALRETLIGAGLEHHLSITYGDVKPGLEAVAARLGLPVLDLDEAA